MTEYKKHSETDNWVSVAKNRSLAAKSEVPGNPMVVKVVKNKKLKSMGVV